MKKSEIFHRSFAELCYALDENNLKISIYTGLDAVKVTICQGDPYLAGIMGGSGRWSGTNVEMKDVKILENQKLWSIIIAPEFKRLKYYFIVESEHEKLYCFEEGIYTKVEYKKTDMPRCFLMSWMNPSDVAKTPKWVENTIWYQIFPDRFCNGDSSINPPDCKKWKSHKVHNLDMYGGDIEGIIQKLDYIKELGVSGIYLNPIFKSSSNHKYNTENYEVIDPCFGDEQTFIKLVDEAHNRGIRIMIDAVFNHSGWDFDKWQDVVKNGEKSRYKDWFMVNYFPIKKTGDAKDKNFYTFAFHKGMPKLNTNNKEVIDYFIDLCKKWVADWKIDAIRFDVGNEVSHRFLRRLRDEVKEINPDVYLVGEIWHDSINWLMGDEYDAVMNYPLTEGIKRFFNEPHLTSQYLEYHYNRMSSAYPEQICRVQMNMFDSHDTIRLINSIDNNIDKFYQMFAVLFTLYGSPSIYYGTEIALEGSYDPDCRRCMPWDDIESGKYSDVYGKIKSLIKLRNEHKAAKSLNLKFTHNSNSRLVAYTKQEGELTLTVLLNCSDVDENISAEGKILFANKFNNGILKKDGVVIFE